MDSSEIIVLFGGIALIALILWYFFGDRAKTEALWDGAVDAFFDGVDDPRLGLIRIHGDSAQFWGKPGGAPAVLAAMVTAKVTGKKPEGASGTTEL